MRETEVVSENSLLDHGAPLLVRFLGKLVLDILPAAFASVIGGFLFTQYQFGHTTMPQPATEQAVPASAEMVKLVRDEHTMIVDFLKTQMAAQKNKLVIEDAESAHAAAEAKIESDQAMQRVAATVAALKTTEPRGKASAPVVAVAALPSAPVASAPLVIARAQAENGSLVSAPSAASGPKALLAKSLDIKDHVVDATLHAVSAIGSIPSWIASMGDRFNSAGANSGPAARVADEAS